MSSVATIEPTGATPYWVEPGRPGGRSRFLAKISGLHCSLCTGTIEKAVSRLPGVQKVAVSLTHEQALVEFDPALVTPEDILRTLKDIGYSVYDPRKLRPYEEEEAELGREGKRLLAAIGLSLITIAMMVQLRGAALLVLDGIVALTLGTLAADGVPVHPPRHPQPARASRVRRLRGADRRCPGPCAGSAGLSDGTLLRRRRPDRQLSPLLRMALAPGEDAQLAGGQATARPPAGHRARCSGRRRGRSRHRSGRGR